MTIISRDTATQNWYHTVQESLDATKVPDPPISSIVFKDDPKRTNLRLTDYVALVNSSQDNELQVAITFYSKCPTGDYDIKIASGAIKMVTLR